MCLPRGGDGNGNLRLTSKNLEEELVALIEAMSSSDEEPPPVLGRIVFFLNNLPFDAETDDGFVDPAEVDGPEHPHYLHYLAKTYLLPLEKILYCGALNASGFVKAIYINFGYYGFYEYSPISLLPSTVPAFEDTLRDVFSGVRVESHWSNELLWREITDDDLPITLIPDVPENCRIIGCLTGGEQIEGSDSIQYDTYIRDAPSDQCFIFLVGQIVDDEEINGLIDDFVEVSETVMDPSDCLERIMGAMQLKFMGWGF